MLIKYINANGSSEMAAKMTKHFTKHRLKMRHCVRFPLMNFALCCTVYLFGGDGSLLLLCQVASASLLHQMVSQRLKINSDAECFAVVCSLKWNSESVFVCLNDRERHKRKNANVYSVTFAVFALAMLLHTSTNCSDDN